MGILELAQKNRSYRKFKEQEAVTTEQLRDFVNVARFAASSVNLQPLRYLLSNEKEKIRLFLPIQNGHVYSRTMTVQERESVHLPIL